MFKKLANNPLVYLFKTNWKYAEDNHGKIILFWCMFIIGNLIELLLAPIVWAKIISIVTLEGITSGSFKTLLLLLSLTLVIDLVFWSLHGPARLLERENAFLARIGYRKFLLRGIMNLSMQWHVDHHSGDTIDKLEKGAAALFGFSESSFEIIKSFVEFMVCYGMLIYFSPSSIAIVTGMLLVNIWITVRFDKVLVGQYKDLNKFENNISESIFDAISNISTVIILRVEGLVFQSIIHKLEKPVTLFGKNNTANELKWFFTSICTCIMAILVLGNYFYQHIGTAGGVLVGSVYLLISYLDKVSNLFFKFTGMYGEVLRRRANVANAEEISESFTPDNFTDHVLSQDWKELQVSGLNFSYERGTRLNLNNVSLSIKRGQKVAVIGKSGGGKTTVLKIMRDLYQAQSLTLSVDGKIVSDGFAGICRAISLVPQNPEIFASTMRNNITLGAEYSEDDIIRFARAACFYDIAMDLPNGLETSIKEKGVNLSGGQRQRLALTRGLIASKDKEIVLLDEPTSSLDKATEMEVYKNIFREFKDKTVVATIHNLGLLPMFDIIYMFEEGRVVGSGTLQELLTTCPEFVQLWNASNNDE